jgi:hypothetical protein
MLMLLVETAVRSVVRAGNRWLGARWLKKQGLTPEGLFRLLPRDPHRMPYGVTATNNVGTEDGVAAPFGRWVGPCAPGEKITFSGGSHLAFEPERLLVKQVRKGEPEALVLGRIGIGDKICSVTGRNGHIDLCAVGNPDGFDVSLSLPKVEPGQELWVDAWLSDALEEGEEIMIDLQFVGKVPAPLVA